MAREAQDVLRLTKKHCQRQRETSNGKPLSDTIRLRRAWQHYVGDTRMGVR
jgi:hypothetical protein